MRVVPFILWYQEMYSALRLRVPLHCMFFLHFASLVWEEKGIREFSLSVSVSSKNLALFPWVKINVHTFFSLSSSLLTVRVLRVKFFRVFLLDLVLPRVSYLKSVSLNEPFGSIIERILSYEASMNFILTCSARVREWNIFTRLFYYC